MKFILAAIVVGLLVIFIGIGYMFLPHTSSLELSEPTYGAKVRFAKHQVLLFPDFDLEYMGITTKPGPKNAAWKFTDYNFKVKNATEEQMFFWSAGTGDLGPTDFVVGGKKYFLELKMTDKLGKLAENELVVTPEEQWLKNRK